MNDSNICMNPEDSCNASLPSFLTILDDKNKVIETLQKKIKNQKLQLMHYFQKDLEQSKLVQLSQSCSPEVMQSNLHVVLAVSRFSQENGIGSHIYRMYRQMCNISEKMQNSLANQKSILKEIVLNLQQHVNNNFDLENILKNPYYLELLKCLLEATLSLQQKLEVFKICCDRLLILEDERNGIAEQAFSLSPEDRLKSSNILRLESEKRDLEEQLKNISREREKFNARLSELKTVEQKLCDLQKRIYNFYISEENIAFITDLLTNLNTDANDLFQSIQKRNNENLVAILEMIDLATDYNQVSEEDLKEVGFDKALFELVRQKIRNAIMHYIDLVKMKETECKCLSEKLDDALKENGRLKVVLGRVQRDLELAREFKDNEMPQLKRKLAICKSQMADETQSMKTVEQLKQFTKQKKTINVMNQNKENNFQRNVTENVRNRRSIHLEETLIERSQVTFKNHSTTIVSQDEISYKKSSTFNMRNSSKHWLSNSKYNFNNISEDMSVIMESIMKPRAKETDDEFELMKDCSRETIPEICYPKLKVNNRAASNWKT